MRKYYQRRLPEDPSKDYYYIIRETSPMQSLLVEYGFIDNSNDRVKLQNDLLNYVEAVVRAIAEYAGVPYTPPEGSGTNFYTVKKGDSLWSIANRFGVTVQELRDANNLTTDLLSVGQVLRIPGNNGNNDNNIGGSTTYTVQKGDSLWSIASRYGISVNDLRRANNLTSDVLSIGQVLIIPGAGNDNEDNNQTQPSTTYTVVKGDSLWKIANQFGVTVQQIRDANNLVTDTLSVGQVLTIPGVSGENNNQGDNNGAVFYYTVEKGDNLWSIARKFGITVQEIRDANDLISDTLSIGQSLIIPGISASDDLEEDNNNDNDNITTNTYTVKSGDSLWSIANQFGVTVAALKDANSLTSNLLSIGQVLLIPSSNNITPVNYTVKSGDSLWSIANRFNTTVDAIKSLNNLTTNLLSVGQILKIPSN